jgi:hypothetical protein
VSLRVMVCSFRGDTMHPMILWIALEIDLISRGMLRENFVC